MIAEEINMERTCNYNANVVEKFRGFDSLKLSNDFCLFINLC